MSLLTITPSFNIILKRDGFSPYSITQAGCSFLFLLPAYHKGTSCHLQHDVPTYGQKIYYTDKPLLNHIKSTLIFLNSCLSHTSPPEPSSILHVIHIIRLAGKQHILPVNISHITALHCITLHDPYLFLSLYSCGQRAGWLPADIWRLFSTPALPAIELLFFSEIRIQKIESINPDSINKISILSNNCSNTPNCTRYINHLSYHHSSDPRHDPRQLLHYGIQFFPRIFLTEREPQRSPRPFSGQSHRQQHMRRIHGA